MIKPTPPSRRPAVIAEFEDLGASSAQFFCRQLSIKGPHHRSSQELDPNTANLQTCEASPNDLEVDQFQLLSGRR